jgi:hypothetical protein
MGEWTTRKVPMGNNTIMSGAPTDNNSKMHKQGHMIRAQPLQEVFVIFEMSILVVGCLL